MKETWKLIEQTVNASFLQDKEKQRVLNELDKTIGSCYIEGEYPIQKGELGTREFIVYRDVLEALNGNDMPTVNNDSDYQKVVKELFKRLGKPDRQQQSHLAQMDSAYAKGDWKEVNKHLKELWND